MQAIMENAESERARCIIEYTDAHLFLTGRAGTGKTTFLRRLRQESAKRMVVLAPTGIAAINAGGSTIHSFFQINPGTPFIPGAQHGKEDFKLLKNKIRLMRNLDLVVIDEISMVRADLLDAVDDTLRRYRNRMLPFGGVQLLLIGDLGQLAPVVKEEEWNILSHYYDTPFFFSSLALKQTRYFTIELQHVYRQSDSDFLYLLNKVRDNRADAAVLQQLNSRYRPNYTPGPNEGCIRLVTHNWQAHQINEHELQQITSQPFCYTAKVTGKFPESSYPTSDKLTLKKGAQVMFVKNDPQHKYFNGMIGEVTDIDSEGFSVRPISAGGATTSTNETIRVAPEEWNNTRYTLNTQTKEIEEDVEGTFRQFPVKLAWAITIHKSQGLTFERAIIDAAAAFAHGQTYVALSRLKSLNGLILSSPIPAHAIINDNTVARFTEDLPNHTPGDDTVALLQREYVLNLLRELYGFRAIRTALNRLLRVLQEHFFRLLPATVAAFENADKLFKEKAEDVAEKFCLQYTALLNGQHDHEHDEHLQERLRKGGFYFAEQLTPLATLVSTATLPTDNKEVKKMLDNALADMAEALQQKTKLLLYVGKNGFQLAEYQHKRSLVMAGEEGSEAKEQKKGRSMQRLHTADSNSQEANAPAPKARISGDISNPKLFQALVDWRYQQSKTLNRPAFQILTQQALIGIVKAMPRSTSELLKVPHVGEKTISNYGSEILAIVERFASH